MAFYNPNQRVPFGAVSLHRISSALTRTMDTLTRAAQPHSPLFSMSPDQLEDIGLTHADVRRAKTGMLAGLWAAIAARYTDWVDARRTARMLRGLNQRQLDDVGLTMIDIERFERTGFLR